MLSRITFFSHLRKTFELKQHLDSLPQYSVKFRDMYIPKIQINVRPSLKAVLTMKRGSTAACSSSRQPSPDLQVRWVLRRSEKQNVTGYPHRSCGESDGGLLQVHLCLNKISLGPMEALSQLFSL